jgi:hypothetical protein
MELNLNRSIKLNAGLVDLEATLTAVAEAIQTHNAKHEGDLDAVADAVNAVFDTYKGQFVPMTMLTSIALTHLDVPTLEARAELTKRVKNYIDANPETFAVTKAKGTSRIADQVPAAE